MSKISSFFDSKYSQANITIRKKATALFYYNLLMCFLLVLLVVFYAFFNKHGFIKGLIGASVIFLFVIFSTILILRGSLTGAVLIYIIPTVILVTAARFVTSLSMPHAAFSSYIFYFAYIIVFIAVFGEKKYIPLVTLLFFTTNIIVFFLVRGSLSGDVLEATNISFANSTPTLLIVGVISYINILLTGDSNRRHKEELEVNKNQLGIIREMLAGINSVSRKLDDTSGSYISTAGHITATSQNQAALVEEATASMESIAAAIEQVSSRVKFQSDEFAKIEESMDNLNRLIADLSGKAEEVMKEASTAAMQGLEADRVSTQVMESMKEIHGNAEKIREITDMITDIADKTSLLSLNASIESARAGEAGKGFAVVADEISKLADNSTESAKEISRLISGTGQSINSSYEQFNILYTHIRNINRTLEKSGSLSSEMNQAAARQHELNRAIAADVDKVNTLSADISRSMIEQSGSTGELSKSLEEINNLTQNNAATAEELSASTEDLTESLKELLALLDKAENSSV